MPSCRRVIRVAMRTLLCAAIGVLLVASVAAQEQPGRSPNVVLIIAEQMRGDALGVLGNPNARTPHLDRLAAEGGLFTHYFVNNPVCAPSRMSLFSGRYPHQHGSVSNKQRRLLDSAEGTLLGYARARGYRIGWFGKDNHTYARAVLDELLDANTSRRREPFRAYTPYIPPHWHGDAPWPEAHLYATQTTQDAIDFIEAEPDAPFFAVLSLFDAHPPYFAPAAYAARHPAAEIVLPPYVNPAALSGRLADYQQAVFFGPMDRAELAATMQHYYAAIEWGVDHQVGRVLQALEAQGLSDETIVVFTADHGDFMGEYAMVRKGLFLYDALVHVPFIWYAPGRIAAGTRPVMLAQGVDLLPTLVEATGGMLPVDGPGQSLWPMLRDGPADPDRVVFAEAGYSELLAGYFADPEPSYVDPPANDDTPFHTRVFTHLTQPDHRTVMARTKEWKLILSETRPPELYHMAGGWTERRNVADDPAHQTVLRTLRAEIERLWPGLFDDPAESGR